MKRQIVTAFAMALMALPATSGAVRYSQGGGYGNGGVILRMDAPMGTVFNPGEEVGFHYQTQTDAYVIVFNIDTDGYVHLLHPETDLHRSDARRTYDVPESRASSLVVSGETGVEFIFALAVPDRSWIDDEELAYLASLDSDRSGAQPYRIEGDPFVAANIIAAELVRGISRRPGVFLGFTYFYINERVDHPCYLCGDCDSRAWSDCDYRVVADFDRSSPMTYPLSPAYDAAAEDVAVYEDDGAAAGGESATVEFYPYSAEVYTVSRPYVYRVYDSYYYDPWYWDPWYAGWNYYPHSRYRSHWGISVGFGWDNSWGWCGYYSSSNYYRPHHYDWSGYGYYDRDYAHGYYDGRRQDTRFKSKYKSGGGTSDKSSALVAGYRSSARRDSNLKVGTKGVRSAGSLGEYRSKQGVRVTRKTSAVKSQRTTSSRRVGATKISGTHRSRPAEKVKRGTITTRKSGRSTVRREGARQSERKPAVKQRSTTRKGTTGKSAVRKNTTRKPSDVRGSKRSTSGKSRATTPRSTSRSKVSSQPRRATQKAPSVNKTRTPARAKSSSRPAVKRTGATRSPAAGKSSGTRSRSSAGSGSRAKRR